MTKDEEDALVDAWFKGIEGDGYENQIRLAIRAAVALERERIAASWDGCMYDDVGGSVDIGAAIRGGHES